MPRRRYSITAADVPIVHRWIRTRFRKRQWPADWPELTAWDTFPLDKPTAKKLQPWCDRFLDAAQWQQLHAVIRSARRDKHATRTVRLSQQASRLLHTLAAREQLTLSATLEHYLGAIVNPPAPGVPWRAEGETRAHRMQVKLFLRVENNSKFVRGRKKATEEIERDVLEYYAMQTPHKDRGEYLLTIPYDTDEELDKIIYDLLGEASSTADNRHCFIEADVQSLDDPDRWW